jgi:hypothetical protein
MKKILLTLSLVSFLTLTTHASFIGVDFISLGSSGIGAIDPNSATGFVQTSNATAFNATAVLGNTFYNANDFGPADWTSANGLYIRSTITTNPNLPFTFKLFNTSFLEVAEYSGTTNSFTTGTSQSDSATYSYLNLTPVGSPNLSDVGYLQFIFNGDAVTSISFQAVSTTAVPEPSTYALLAIAAVGFFLSIRRRKVQE